MRREFGRFMADVAERDNKIYLIVGDIGYGIFDEFRQKFPTRFINIGICEQSMIGIAAGLALQGLKPYVYTITPFLVERPFEQIKIDIDLNDVDVKLIGYADYPGQGMTHEIVDPIGLMERFNNIISYAPVDQKDTRWALEDTYLSRHPAFINLRRDKNGI